MPGSLHDFNPPPGLRGGHRQTLAGFFFRRHLDWTHPVEDVVVDAGDDVRLLVRASWQPGPREARPLLVTVHGLGGWDAATYGLATGQVAWARGWHVARMNMRSAGDAALVCARLYNAGLDGDLLAVLRHFADLVPRIALCGFSLGGNMALLMAGRRAAAVPAAVRAVAAVSPPVDLLACVEALERPANLAYQRYFVVKLQEAYRWRQSLRPDLYEAGRERGVRTVREYDERITAPHAGFASAREYYERSSAGPWLSSIERPTLLLTASDDPLIPAHSVTGHPLPSSGTVVREVAPTGGHVGFVGRADAPGRFWAARRVTDFFAERLEAGG